jgi:hypothetical protein
LEEHRDQGVLVLTYQAAEFRRQCDHDMKVRHRQEQFALTLKPSGGRVMPALRARAMPAGVKEQMFAMTVRAFGDMAAERACAAKCQRLDGTNVTRQYGVAVPLQVVLAMPTQNIGDSKHGSAGG